MTDEDTLGARPRYPLYFVGITDGKDEHDQVGPFFSWQSATENRDTIRQLLGKKYTVTVIDRDGAPYAE